MRCGQYDAFGVLTNCFLVLINVNVKKEKRKRKNYILNKVHLN